MATMTTHDTAREDVVSKPSAGAHRYAGVVKWASVAVMVISLFVAARALPVDRGVQALTSWVSGFGAVGPVVYAVVYVIAALLFVPGSALTLAAGAVFGLLWGAITVSIASTTAAALAFLIARYLARSVVAKQARQYPRFAAIDRAIGLGGAKIVGMLRLSPAVPFSVGNYLFGLTAVRFWPYVLASWVCMLPGTFMYVYLGYLAREGLESAAAEQTGRRPAEWALLIVGLVATVAVTVYVTRLARRALKEQTEIDSAEPASTEPEAAGGRARRGWPWDATALALMAAVMLVGAACAHWKSAAIRGLFGPAPVTLKEVYERKPGGPTFDHGAYDALVKAHVDEHGWVNYEGIRSESAKLDGYIDSIAGADFASLGRDERLALLINAYNAFTIRLILDYYPVESIKDIPANKRWEDARWTIGGTTYTLNQIEHEQIRPKFKEPRIHFALVCAAIGCPILRNEAYRGARIEEQLEAQARYVHTHDRWFQFGADKGVARLTKLYDWYGGDFAQVAGSVLRYAARYAPKLEEALESEPGPRIEWLAYDWALNDVKNRP